MSIHICYGPRMQEVTRDHLGVKWCFHERKRFMFDKVVTAPVEPSYYGPDMFIECTSCKKHDVDLFPGYTREWEE